MIDAPLLPDNDIYRHANDAWFQAVHFSIQAAVPSAIQKNQFKSAISRLIYELDQVISDQLSDVIQHESFKSLESAWRNLYHLIQRPRSNQSVLIRLLDMNWEEVSKDLNYVHDIRLSRLYRQICAQELETAGGLPFGVILVDRAIEFEPDRNGQFDDLYTLQMWGEIGELALCPLVFGIQNTLLGDDVIQQTHDIQRAHRIFASDDFESWRLLRQKKSSRFLHLVFPDYLQRTAYSNLNAGFIFSEPQSVAHCLWGNAAYLLVSNIIREYERISWFGFLRSHDHSGQSGAIITPDLDVTTTQMPFEINQSGMDHNESSVIGRVDLFYEQENRWAEFGFVPMSSVYLTGQKGFFSNRSIWQVPAELSEQLGLLQTNLMACRFGHYIKIQLRDQIGRYDSAEECKRTIERWLNPYVMDLDYADDDMLARYPLRSAKINIHPTPEDSTRYQCDLILQPQYQYEMQDAQVMLTTFIQSSAIPSTSNLTSRGT